MLLTEKYKPRGLSQVKGQEFALKRLKESIGKKESCIIYGGVGNGKTSSVHALADELGWEIFELSASDARNKEAVNSVLFNAAKQSSLFNQNKIILIDDIDALDGRKDFGGLQAITELIPESRFPFVLTAYDIEDGKFKALKKICNVIEFDPVDSNCVFELLREISGKEMIKADNNILKGIARKCGGDVRNAINELNLLSLDENTEFSYKDSRSELLELLNIIFKSKNGEEIIKTVNAVDLELNEVLLWLDENLPFEYNADGIIKAYDMLSKADMFKGRIINRQYYRFLVYQKLLMSLGVALAKDEKNKSFIPYKRPGRLLKIWIANRKNARKKEISGKIAEKTHMSKKKSIHEFPYMNFILDSADELGLNDEEIAYLKYR